MERFNDNLRLPYLAPVERVAILFDYISHLTHNVEKCNNTELLMLEGKLLYSAALIEKEDKVVALFFRSVTQYLEGIRYSRSSEVEQD